MIGLTLTSLPDSQLSYRSISLLRRWHLCQHLVRQFCELKALRDLLSNRITQGAVSEFCSSHNIQWKYIPERSPHFGGIWESAVKSAKTHLKCVVSPVRLTFEEFTTVLTQIEACLNSRPLTPVNSPDDDGISALTPGHFLIGQPLTSLPDSQLSYRSISLLRRKYNKWRFPSLLLVT